jgi:hypothetical protein
MAGRRKKIAAEAGAATLEMSAAATGRVRSGYCGMPNAAEPARQKFAPSQFQ